MYRQIAEKTAERVTDGVAVVGIASWWWLDHVESVFGALLPVLGCVWLGTQMWHFYLIKRKK